MCVINWWESMENNVKQFTLKKPTKKDLKTYKRQKMQSKNFKTKMDVLWLKCCVKKATFCNELHKCNFLQIHSYGKFIKTSKNNIER